jgi:large subunit ribosomal protein L9
MKVILNATVPKVGKQGTVVNVADGYARNYLFPRGLAIYADKVQIAALERRNERTASKVAGLKSDAEVLKAKLNGALIRIPGQVGAAQGKLFGAITSSDIVEAVAAQLGTTLDKKQVALVEPIKKLGTQQVHLDLHRDVDAIISVEVYDPNAPVVSDTPAEVVEEEELPGGWQ